MENNLKKQPPVSEVKAMQDSGGVVKHRTGTGVVSGLILCFWVLCSNEEGEGGEGGIKVTELARTATSPLFSC